MAITENIKLNATETKVSHPTEHDGLPTPQRYFAAATLLLVIAIGVIDSSITNIALPTISQSLNIAPATAVWIVNAYTITIIATLLPFSSLAERIGFKRLLRIGLVIFTLGAIGSMFADTLTQLLMTRIIQGFGCSALMSLFGGLVRHIYPRDKLAMGISLNAMTVGMAALISPSLGAFIIDFASWHWIYGFAIPLCMLAFIMTAYVPRVKRIQKRFDYISALLNALSFGSFIAALDLAFSQPWLCVTFLLTALIAGYFLYQRAHTQTQPLVPLDLLKVMSFRDAVIVSSMSFSAASLTMISASFYFHSVLELSPSTIGLLFSAWPIATLIIAPLSAKLSNKYPASILAGIGNLTMAISLGCLLLLDANAHPIYFGCCLFSAGAGFAFFQTPNNKVIILSAPPHRASATGGMQSTARLFGQCIGAALVSVCFTLSPSNGQYYGITLAFIIISLACLVNIARYWRKSDVTVF